MLLCRDQPTGSLKGKASKEIAVRQQSAFNLGAIVSMPFLEMTAAARMRMPGGDTP